MNQMNSITKLRLGIADSLSKEKEGR